MTILLRPEPLSAEVFKPYGDVIEVRDNVKHFGINYGHTERYHDLANVDVSAAGGRAIVNIFRSNPLPLPIAIKLMERHPLSSQAFMPLGNQPYLVVVAPAGAFQVTQLRAFIATAHQGVNYSRGTWHHYCLALHTISDFLVVDRGGEGDNCDEVALDEWDIQLHYEAAL